MLEYQIVKSSTWDSLVILVNDMIKTGWDLQGNPFQFSTGIGLQLGQALVRQKTEDTDPTVVTIAEAREEDSLEF